MKALSIRAPWWWFILHAGKDIENRDWHTNFRGTVLLHASKWWKQDKVIDDVDDAIDCFKQRPSADHNGAKITWEEMGAKGGHIVGKVDIVDCVVRSNSPWFFGAFGFVLANPVVFKTPIPCRSALGLFDVPKDVEYLLKLNGNPKENQ